MSTLFEAAQSLQPSAMEPPDSSSAAKPSSVHTTFVETESSEVTVQNITARFFFNRPTKDLIPARFLQMAQNTPAVQRKAWIFRIGADNARHVNVRDWPEVDIRYRGVFRTLKRVPRFEKGLWEGGSDSCQEKLDDGQPRAQSQLVYALLNEIGEMLDLKRETKDEMNIFYLRPRLLACQLEYWTGYRQKYKDGPETDGYLSLDFEPDRISPIPILPVSTTTRCFRANRTAQSKLTKFQTNTEEPLESSLANKFKLMLGQLLQHVKPLPVPGDKIPDQEIFLIGQHGSKLHLLRAFFPGHKMSSLWCRRELPCPAPIFPPMSESLSPSPPASSPRNPTSVHIEHSDGDESEADATSPVTRRLRRRRSSSHRFYAAENIERLRRHFEATKLSMLDRELDTRTFRVLGTREFDLWKEDDFAAAIHVLVALEMYLLSGKARCGMLQQVFLTNPYPGDSSGTASEDGEAEVEAKPEYEDG
ncbi:uncharacterized protein N7482_001234 [Penicillium canariense]|uniref:Uncharacterized protein n=1 Tax=Penicillium canariense TaxID=189055 RepID=A0A9W9IF95_9EURO|nr:uncharacterized protein N7482_001234 [Penicillium canariense]KAJ5175357.1 hypothetical protein N7482_001234 [Penicillium canariense]